MDQHSFKKRILEKCISDLAEASLVVMDNASFHSFFVESVPHASWNKIKLKEWVASKSMLFPEAALKVELVDLSNHHKEKRPRYAAAREWTRGIEIANMRLNHIFRLYN